jgi:hypothetical protein
LTSTCRIEKSQYCKRFCTGKLRRENVVGSFKDFIYHSGRCCCQSQYAFNLFALRGSPMGNLDRFYDLPSEHPFKADPIEPSEGILRFRSTPLSTATKGCGAALDLVYQAAEVIKGIESCSLPKSVLKNWKQSYNLLKPASAKPVSRSKSRTKLRKSINRVSKLLKERCVKLKCVQERPRGKPEKMRTLWLVSRKRSVLKSSQNDCP